MSRFTLLGHYCPFGRYPSPVIPVGQYSGRLTAAYPAEAGLGHLEWLPDDIEYVAHTKDASRRLTQFNYNADRLFAYSDIDIVYYAVQREAEFVSEFLRNPLYLESDPYIRLTLAKLTNDPSQILAELANCARDLESLSAPFGQSWVDREMISVRDQLGRSQVPEEPRGRIRGDILLADDERSLLRVLQHYFEATGCSVRTACDGMDAIQKATESRPDVIVLDLMMPRISGFDVITRLRNDPATKTVPIVVLSALISEQARPRCFRLGADRYIAKPSTLKEITDGVFSFLQRAQ